MKEPVDETQKLPQIWQHLLWSVSGLTIVAYLLLGKNVDIKTSLGIFALGLGCAFTSYGITCFIGDLRESTSFKDLKNKIRSNHKRGWKKW